MESSTKDFVATLVIVGVGFFILYWLKQRQLLQQQQLMQQQIVGSSGTPLEGAIASAIPVVGALYKPAQQIQNDLNAKYGVSHSATQEADQTSKQNVSTEGGTGFSLNVYSSRSGWAPWAKSVGHFFSSGEIVEPWKW